MHSSRKLRFRVVANDIVDTLIGMSAEPRLMPGAAAVPTSPATDPAVRTIRSSASTPSLRSRDGTVPPHARMDPGGNVRVVVRVRAFLPREIEKQTQCLIRMDPRTQATTLLAPPSDTDKDVANFAKPVSRRAQLEDRTFTFDNSFWSHDNKEGHYAKQEDVYNCLGEEFLDHNFEGYHTCIFAYGQTGSGKSYTMMGTQDQPGLIPRTCEDLFQRIEAAQEETPNIAYNVRVSYFEVYNEHVRDLLVPVVPSQAPYYLKIRESPTEGPYVKDLTEVPVRSLDEILRYMQMGDNSRTTASTKMNDTSSRSHAVFTIMLRQIHHDMETDETTERSSRIRLVDLAGSERAKATEATGQRLREGSNINKSLTTLGRVIAALADPKHGAPASPKKGRNGTPKKRGGEQIVPYRDSILTWLLKDSLGGNSKTAMIACIAPGDYDETLSTLRYADQAKRIRTRAVVNQDSMSTAERDAQMAAMAEEIRRLQLSVSDSSRRREKDAQLQEERIEEYQNHVAAMQRMMEENALVAEGKIRGLQTENEALRLHLKLALESLKNPIPAVPVTPQQNRRSSVGLSAGGIGAGNRRKSRLSGVSIASSMVQDRELKMGDKQHKNSDPEDKENIDEAFYDDDDVSDDVSDVSDEEDEAVFYSEQHASEMQDYMQSLLSDLGLFRRKIGDDKQRFLSKDSPSGMRQPLTLRTNV